MNCACGAALGAKNKSGRCRPCSARFLNSDPVIVENRRRAQAAFFAQPETKAKLRARMAFYLATMPENEMERRREHGRMLARDVLSRPEVRAAASSPDARRRAGIGRTDTVLAWCPPAYRQRYRDLQSQRLANAAEAKAMILDEVAADERRRLAALSPLKRQLERAAKHGIVDKPVLRRAAHAFTLGGVSDFGA